MNYHSYRWIKDKVKEHNDSIDSNNVIGTFYHGSGNYGLDTEFSDVDTLTLLLPTPREIFLNQKPISTCYFWDNGEQLEVKDIRLFIQELRKQNITALEILFTDYDYFPNPWVKHYCDKLFIHGEEIARYNPYKAIMTTKGMANNIYGKVITNKSNQKYCRHVCRLGEYLEKYIAGKDYLSCLRTDRRSELLNATEQDAAKAIEYINEVANSVSPNDYKIDRGISEFMDNWLCNFLADWLDML